jgi:hypothetical protein
MQGSKRVIRRILGEHKKYEAKGISFSTPGKTHKAPKCVTDTISVSVLFGAQFMNFMCKKERYQPSLNYFQI